MINMFKVIDNRLFVNTKLIVKPDSLSLIQEQNAMFKNKKTRLSLLKQNGLYYTWTPEMHERFAIAAMGQGIKSVTPKQIISVLDKPEMTRERVSSHLQKFR